MAALVHGDEPSSSEDGAQIRRNGDDATATDLRRTMQLTITSGVDAEEARRELMSVVRPGQEMELCATLLECCRQESTAGARYYGLLAQRLCAVGLAYQAGFEACFARIYTTVHHLCAYDLRGAARLYAHLLATDSVSWAGLLGGCVRLTEEDATPSSRIFIKLLFQELSAQLGMRLLGQRINNGDPVVRDALFPKDSLKNTRFAINFFTWIGLPGLTESARECFRKG